ncbi:pilus assembly protein TadG-related protein [Primorskyibacter aestuariivivens]|uniref:TadE/TadG family type IV pilus assembly protein n=1 Tax=Primorskyibacter aestuariivivens TaxID=1888912 RepID=UPI002301B68E|nr:TadE/TadG family type IV pilus assembly protein [Primorskyibacter aestuariivivens]MDA7427529.1 pilus assembly protein TadG-related protein [Primorskyibacter aestuariivivens]
MRVTRKRTQETFTRFLENEDGNTTIVSIYMSLAILLLTGAAIDVMRYESIRTKMQHAMDRAVLAAADLDQESEPKSVVYDYVNKAGVSDALTNVVVEEGANYRMVTATGTTDVNTLFMRMGGIDQLSAPALSAAEEKIANVEISMVLDISGSMRWNSRMLNAKAASKKFVDKVLTTETNGVTTLNVVPYAGHVNPGSEMFEYFRGERPEVIVPVDNTTTETKDYFEEWPQAISNIVLYFDQNENGEFDDRTDIAYKIEGWPEGAPRDIDTIMNDLVGFVIKNNPELNNGDGLLGISIKGGETWPNKYYTVYGNTNGSESDLGPTNNKGKVPGGGDTYQYNEITFGSDSTYYQPSNQVVTERNVNMPSSCIEIYDSEFDTTALPTSDDYVPHFMYWEQDEDVMDWGWCPEDDTAIQYYSDDAVALKAFIDDIRMHDGTGAQYGMKYALSLLDPNTSAAISHMITEGVIDAKFEGRPIAWGDAETEKFILLMSDGMITDQHRPNDPYAPVNGEVELEFQGAEYHYNFSAASKNVENLYKQCDLAKQKGVIIFTVAFETSDDAANVLKNCASSPSHFFRTQGTNITDTFDVIARQINNLRLIQ